MHIHGLLKSDLIQSLDFRITIFQSKIVIRKFYKKKQDFLHDGFIKILKEYPVELFPNQY